MQQDNNIENKLRQMEAMEQPDLSQADDHWQKMAAMLQPAVLPVKKGWPKWMLNGLSAAAIVIVSVVIWYMSSKKNDAGKDVVIENSNVPAEVSNNSNPASLTPTSITAETVVEESVVSPATFTVSNKLAASHLLSKHDFNIKPAHTNALTTGDTLLAGIKLNYIPCDGCDEKKDNVPVKQTIQQTKLQQLFGELQKEEQHFTIDNRRDTLLQFKEGTALLIPANSFGGVNSVELIAKEFYKTSDIVLNQLNTASNKEQLITGGMLQINASYKGNKLNVDKQKPLTLFMPDTSSNMNGMQLFSGSSDESIQRPVFADNRNEAVEMNNKLTEDFSSLNNSSQVNWISRGQYFVQNQLVTQVWVFNIIDEPFRSSWPVNDPGEITAYFIVSDSIAVERKKLKEILKEKYGYYKVKLRSDIHNWFKEPDYNRKDYNRDYATRLYLSAIDFSIHIESPILVA